MNTKTPTPDLSLTETPGLFRRLAALLYDGLLLLAILFLASGLALMMNGGEPLTAGNPLYSAYIVLIAWLYFAWPWVHGGQTLGMRTWKLYLYRDSGHPMRWRDTAWRFAAAILSLAPCGLGVLWCLFDRSGRTWHGRLSHTRLVLKSS